MRGAIALLDRYGVEVVGLQELQRPQRQRPAASLAGDRYAVYSPPGDTENSIAWRRDRWAFVSADTVPIPYFHGNIRDKPIVRLRSLATGEDAIFVNVHNPADVRGNAARLPGRGAAPRARDHAVTRTRYDVPVFLDRRLQRPDQGVLPTHRRRHPDRVRPAAPHAGPLHRHRATTASTGSSGPRHTSWAGHSVVGRRSRSAISDHPLVVARVSHQARRRE